VTLDVVQVSDLHITEAGEVLGQDARANLELILADVDARGLVPEVVVATGDLAHAGEAASYAWLRERFAALGVPVYCLPGNHDSSEPFAEHLVGGSVQAVPDADVDGWTFVFLDSNGLGRTTGNDGAIRDTEHRTHDAHAAHLLPADARRCSDLLADDRASPIMMWLHHPPIAHPIARGLEDRAFTQWFLQECASSGRVRGVSAGHIHNAFAAERAGIQFWTCPSGWLDLDFDAGTIVPPGYRHFRFHADGTIESTAYFVEDPRYADRPPYPAWVPKVLAGLERE
jgi:Icc protein